MTTVTIPSYLDAADALVANVDAVVAKAKAAEVVAEQERAEQREKELRIKQDALRAVAMREVGADLMQYAEHGEIIMSSRGDSEAYTDITINAPGLTRIRLHWTYGARGVGYGEWKLVEERVNCPEIETKTVMDEAMGFSYPMQMLVFKPGGYFGERVNNASNIAQLSRMSRAVYLARMAYRDAERMRTEIEQKNAELYAAARKAHLEKPAPAPIDEAPEPEPADDDEPMPARHMDHAELIDKAYDHLEEACRLYGNDESPSIQDAAAVSAAFSNLVIAERLLLVSTHDEGVIYTREA